MRFDLVSIAVAASLACSGATSATPGGGGTDAGTAAGSGSTDAGGINDAGGVNDGDGINDGGGVKEDTGGAFPAAPGAGLMPSDASGWRAFAPRPQGVPATSIANGTGGYVLNASGKGAASVYGGWTTRITGLQGGSYYRFTARARPSNVESLRESVTILLRWRGSFGDEVQPDYVWDFDKQADGAIVFDRTLQAPAGTTAVDVELVLQWSANGQVGFDQLTFNPASAPPARNVRVAAVYYRPSGTRSGQESVQQAATYAGQVAATSHPDVILLGELLNVIGASGNFDTNAETIPGPSTDFVAGIARANRVNIVFGMVERVGDVLYNSAVLLDRTGAIAGKYHKVQLPISDASSGLTPGDSVPVFDTDFGKVAILICQDAWFPEPAREATLKGAELLLVPIWGGKTTLVHARAVENGIHLAASGYDYASEVVNPLGTVLASVTIGNGPKVAVADIELSQRFREEWLGDWRDISAKERRSAPYQFQLP